LIPKLLTIYEKTADAGLHGAAEWLLSEWGQGQQINEVNERLAAKEDTRSEMSNDRAWYITSQAHTMVVLQADSFLMGSPASELGRDEDEPLHQRKIGRRFSISSKEVTKGQYRRFQRDNPQVARENIDQWVKTDDSPQVFVTWYEAAWYCFASVESGVCG
jgi:formylglycine-generating enzyme required for sulfatase activity